MPYFFIVAGLVLAYFLIRFGCYKIASKTKWIINNDGELGVSVLGFQFFLYKGESIGHSGTYRQLEKREFGEVAYPFGKRLETLTGSGWKPIRKL